MICTGKEQLLLNLTGLMRSITIRAVKYFNWVFSTDFGSIDRHKVITKRVKPKIQYTFKITIRRSLHEMSNGKADDHMLAFCAQDQGPECFELGL